MSDKAPIYLDNQATTPLDPRVLEAMMPYFTVKFGNPNSGDHAYGWEAEHALDKSRALISALINGAAGQVIFTSGATEANNLAIKGLMQRVAGMRPHLVTLASEHSCVLESARWCEMAGFQVTIVPVGQDGHVDLNRLASAVTHETALVSVMAVNNEIGVIHPLSDIADIAHAKGALLHTDAAQAYGKIPLDVEAMGIDMLSLSAHKMYGPKGVGALWLRRGDASHLFPQMSGGGQEGGLRSGTQAPALVAGLGEATRLASLDMAQEEGRMAHLTGRLFKGLRGFYPGLRLNGAAERRWAGNLNICFEGLRADLLLSALQGVAVSTGAACGSGDPEPSPVLRAIGLSREDAASSIRLGVGRFTTDEDVDEALSRFETAIRTARTKVR